MNPIVLFLVGFTTSALSYWILIPVLHRHAFLRPNYASRDIPAIGGLVPILAFVLLAIMFSTFLSFDEMRTPVAFLVIIFGFAIFGLIDDLFGNKTSQGFRGHIGALLRGKLTTGLLKILGGPSVSFVTFLIQDGDFSLAVLNTFIIALIANLFNLLDLSPGRTIKYALLVLIPFLFVGGTSNYAFVVVGSFAALVALDLREQFMLGDVGANLIGATIGCFAVAALGTNAKIAVAIAVLALNIVSEFISFSKVISNTKPLRLFDYLGQTPQRKAWANSKHETL